MKRDLACLRDWLVEMDVTHVGMEATGVYSQPVYAALEASFTVIVGNASHMRNVPGRKTDVKDAEWIADLVRHGLVRASFVPRPEVRMLRELVRHCKAVAGNLAAERNRTLQFLESANIKLAGVMGDVFGVSGMLMLRALADGGAAPAEMAELAKRRLRQFVGLARPQQEIDRLPGCVAEADDLGAETAKRTSQRFAAVRRTENESPTQSKCLPAALPGLAPDAFWCARAIVLSMQATANPSAPARPSRP